MSAAVRLDAVTKRYPAARGGAAVTAVDAVSLDVPAGAFVSLLGPSGCGKTTLLRLVGGFERPDAGRIAIGGADVTALPPQARPTAMVFQHYALFPTMTVGENVGYGLAVRRRPRAEVAAAVRDALARVDLAGLEGRPVAALSGGQQQRVALARALAVAPAVLLFDEPLSNLDLALREATRAELKRLQRELGTTSLYVTHDQTEALALSDVVAVMRAGRVEQVGPPETLYSAPETAYVARFLGGANVITDPALAGRLAGEAPPPGHVLAVRPDALDVRPDALDVTDAAAREAEGPRGVEARVLSRQFLGLHSEWALEAAGTPLRLWTAPGRAVPERAILHATAFRWVRADDEPAPEGEPAPARPVHALTPESATPVAG